jgi:hypothetical protein
VHPDAASIFRNPFAGPTNVAYIGLEHKRGFRLDLDVLTQFPKLFKEIQDLVKEPMEKRRENRRAFFEREIAPVHESMEAIHKDYSSAFAELLDLFEREGDVQRTVELMRKRRLTELPKRQDVRAFHDAVANLKRRSYLQKRELEALRIYAESIWEYLTWTGPVQKRESWFKGFIDAFQRIASQGESPFLPRDIPEIVATRPPVISVKSAYYAAVHEELPAAWQQYLKAYRELKLEFTR